MSAKQFYRAVLLTCILAACDYVDTKLRIVNLAEFDIAVFVNFHYPDTSFHNSSLNQYVTAQDTGSAVVVNQRWEDAFSNFNAITLFILPNDSVTQYGARAKDKLVPTKKIILTKAKLDSMHWIITFQ